jgi:hypothetical protein
MPDLILTNGDSAGFGLRDAGKAGLILPWRDVLHEGPIVAGPLEACSAERVPYLAHRFHIAPDEIAAEFAERDAILKRHADFDRIELWFEHDLYDQLQLVQILSALADLGRSDGVVLVQADDFLGTQPADTILRFAARQRPVSEADLILGAAVWTDLAAPTPEPIARRIDTLDPRLPFLKSALARFLDELPAPGNGLSRTEESILDGIDGGTINPVRLFPAVIAGEEAAFMGDSSFFGILDDLASCDVPLIAGLAPAFDGEEDSERLREATLELTMAGEEVVNGEEDHVELSGLDRWWGGTHLQGRAVWRFDRGARRLVAPGAGS